MSAMHIDPVAAAIADLASAMHALAGNKTTPSPLELIGAGLGGKAGDLHACVSPVGQAIENAGEQIYDGLIDLAAAIREGKE